ncbi:MAG: hypothetical protein ACXWZ2_14035 [Mycobacterium sp.]
MQRRQLGSWIELSAEHSGGVYVVIRSSLSDATRRHLVNGER